jgi:hypothetical protein
MAGWAYDGDAALSEADVHVVVEDGGEGVAHEGGEEDQGNDGVGEGVVFLKLDLLVSSSRVERDSYVGN